MNARFLAAFLCLASLSGCIIHNEDDDCCVTQPPPAPQPLPGDVTFLWTFVGDRCADVPQVKNVQVRIGNEVLHNNGIYPCSAGSWEGITLHDFNPGTYPFSLDAVGYDNTVLYTATGSFTINGDVSVKVDLTPNGSPSSYAYLSWFFPNGASCSQAGVSSVEVVIDNDLRKTFNCTDGNSTASSVKSPYLAPGRHSIQLSAYDLGGVRRYYFQGILTTQSGAPIDAEYNLWGETGRVTLYWTLSKDGGQTTITCDAAQVQTLSIDFQDANGRWVFNGQGKSGPCNQPPAWFDLAPGRYRVSVFGVDNTNTAYRSSDSLFVDIVANQSKEMTVSLVRPAQ